MRVIIDFHVPPQFTAHVIEVDYATVPRKGEQVVLNTKWHDGPHCYEIGVVRWDEHGVPTLFLGSCRPLQKAPT